MRILLLANPSQSADQLRESLGENHFEVESITQEQELLAQVTRSKPEAVLVNLAEAPGNRLGLADALRKENLYLPVLGFNPGGTREELLSALENGFDDYLGNPFSTPELVARLKGLIRRAGYLEKMTTLKAGDIAIDLLKREVRRAGKLVDLQPREFSMLEFMLRNPGQPLTKLMIMQRVWNYNFDPQTNIVDVLICRLRSKIEDGFAIPVIQTVRGVGYLFTPNEAASG